MQTCPAWLSRDFAAILAAINIGIVTHNHRVTPQVQNAGTQACAAVTAFPARLLLYDTLNLKCRMNRCVNPHQKVPKKFSPTKTLSNNC